jgi:hypothetical protein
MKKGIYKHFKGNMYEVRGTVQHSETGETLVLYKHCNEEQLWVRPLEMFKETIERNGITMKRFEFVKMK